MGICKRGYRGVFWDSFGRGKCARGSDGRSIKKLFIDRLEKIKSSIVGC